MGLSCSGTRSISTRRTARPTCALARSRIVRRAELCACRRLINLIVNFPGHAPVVGELQIHYRPILELKEYELHFHYEIMRAKGIGELIP